MISPLSSRPYHFLKWEASNFADIITALFFDVLSCLNSKWGKYSEYYMERISTRNKSLLFYPDEIIQISSNQLYPSKIVEVGPPLNLDLSKFKYIEPKKEEKDWQGICAGMCIDHMRRVKESKKPFLETIKEIAEKFKDGSTKKGYIAHQTTRKVAPSKEYVDKIMSKESLKTYGGIPDDIDPIHFPALTDTLIKKYKLKKYQHVLSKFNSKFTMSGWPQNYDSLPNGDYFISQNPSKGHGHAICLYKRDEGTAIFDPNYGTLFFKNNENLSRFIEESTKKLFKSVEVSIDFYECKNRRSC